MQYRLERSALRSRRDLIYELSDVAGQRSIFRRFLGDIGVYCLLFLLIDFVEKLFQVARYVRQGRFADIVQRDIPRYLDVFGAVLDGKRETGPFSVHMVVKVFAFDEAKVNKLFSLVVGETLLEVWKVFI